MCIYMFGDIFALGWRGFIREGAQSTRWSTTLSSKGKLPHEIDLRALCGANVVTPPLLTQFALPRQLRTPSTFLLNNFSS